MMSLRFVLDSKLNALAVAGHDTTASGLANVMERAGFAGAVNNSVICVDQIPSSDEPVSEGNI